MHDAFIKNKIDELGSREKFEKLIMDSLQKFFENWKKNIVD